MIEHGSRHLRRRPRRAASVVEFLVAASLVLVIITASSITLRTTQRSVARDRARDTVTVLASNVLEQSALFDCQLSIEPSLSVRRSDEQRGTGPTPCVQLMFGEDEVTENYSVDGDFVFLTNRPGCATSCETLVVVASRWLPLGGDTYSCRIDTTSPPAMLERRAFITWTPAGASQPLENEFISVEAVPRSASFTDPSRVSLVVPANPGEVVLLRTTQPGTDGALLRVATTCLNQDGSTGAEAFFPFLDTNSPLEAVLTGTCLPIGYAAAVPGCAPPEWSKTSLAAFYGQNTPVRSRTPLPVADLRRCAGRVLRAGSGTGCPAASGGGDQ